MRKGLVVAGVLALAGMAGFGVAQWSKSRVVAEVEATFAGLRATGATVSHEGIGFDVWSRQITIDKVTLTSPTEPKVTLGINRVTASGINPTSARRAAKLVLLDTVTIGSAGQPQRALATMATARLEDFELVTPPAERRPVADDTVTRLVAASTAIKIGAVAVPELRIRADLTAPASTPPATISVDYVYRDVRMTGIDDGRITSLQAANFAFSATVPPIAGQPGGPLSGTIEGLSARDIDLLPVFELGLDRRKPTDGFYRVQGEVSAGRYAFKDPSGTEMSIASMNGREFWLDPAKLSYRSGSELYAILSTIGPNPTPDQTARIMNAMALGYEAVRLDSFEMVDLKGGFPAAAGSGDVTIGTIALDRVLRGKAAAFRIGDVIGGGASPGGKRQSIELKRFVLNDLNFGHLLRTIGSQSPRPTPAEQARMAAALVDVLSGFEVAGFRANNAAAGPPVDIEQVAANWGGPRVNGVPTQARTAFKGKVPLNPADPNFSVLFQSGVRVIDLTVDVGAAYDQRTSRIVLSPVNVSGIPLGGLSGTVRIANVSAVGISFDAAAVAAALPLWQLDESELTIKDGGIVALAQTLAGPDAAAMLVQGLSAAISPGAPPPPDVAEILGAVQTFLSKPGGTLALTLTPRGQVPLAVLGAGPAALLSAVEVKAVARP